MALFFRPRRGAEASRIEALEDAMTQLVRAHKEETARLQARLDALWAIAFPAWIREAIPHAEQLGWLVEPTANSLIFRNLTTDDRCTLTLPLPEDEDSLVALQKDLHLRLGFVGPSARRAA